MWKPSRAGAGAVPLILVEGAGHNGALPAVPTDVEMIGTSAGRVDDEMLAPGYRATRNQKGGAMPGKETVNNDGVEVTDEHGRLNTI